MGPITPKYIDLQREPIPARLDQAKEVLKIEAEGILGLIDRLGPEFEAAVDLILASKGRVIVTGIGKSGLVGRKISATLNSTGTPSLFLHPTEAIHGDLGMVMKRDVILALSNSGETEELNQIIPDLKGMGVSVIAMTGRSNSTLARNSHVVLNVGVDREACPLGLAPTASTTATLAMGDALSVVLLTKRGFQERDFYRFHPGGNLSERLSLRVAEVMLTGDDVPVVTPDMPMIAAIAKIDRMDLGVTLVADNAGVLKGIITDGDLRRAFLKGSLTDRRVEDVMIKQPKAVGPDQLASEVLEIMEENLITCLPIVDSRGGILGIVHLHDLLGRGKFKFTVK
ncbi:MAG: KpsF/GutQ family sugar-phosphate isomerase [Deltaproteobacteria bacterium]|nr:KpsF/GutQ family sugar-phosphate isomerase [Deltaproteobacteria bacterium]